MATNILTGLQYVQQQGELGRQQGLQDQFNRLAGQAYSAAPEQRNALVGQAVGIDPKAGLALGEALQTNETDHIKKLSGAARYMAQALQSNNPAQIEGAYQAVRPYLAKIGQKMGKVPPPTWDASMEPGVYQLVAQTGGDSLKDTPSGFQQFQMTARAAGLQPGTPEYRQAANIALGREGRASNAGIGFQKITGADGRERIGRSNPRTGAFEVYNEQTGQFEPLGGNAPDAPPTAGGQPGAPQATLDQLLTQASQIANQGGPGANIEQADAWLRRQMTANGLSPQVAANPDLAVSRSPEDTAAATEAAKQGVALDFLPRTEAVKTQAAIDQARGTAVAKNEVEKQARMPKDRAAIASSNAELDRLAAAARDVMNAPGLDRITGIPGALPNVPGSAAANAQAKLDALRSQVGFAVLQNMRNNSPTGGALGQISDRENELLQNNLAALGREQSGAEYRKQLQKIIDYAEASKARRLDAFNATYESGVPKPATSVAPATNGGVDSLLNKYGVQ